MGTCQAGSQGQEKGILRKIFVWVVHVLAERGKGKGMATSVYGRGGALGLGVGVGKGAAANALWL
jgi:hypothetical protein